MASTGKVRIGFRRHLARGGDDSIPPPHLLSFARAEGAHAGQVDVEFPVAATPDSSRSDAPEQGALDEMELAADDVIELDYGEDGILWIRADELPVEDGRDRGDADARHFVPVPSQRERGRGAVGAVVRRIATEKLADVAVGEVIRRAETAMLAPALRARGLSDPGHGVLVGVRREEHAPIPVAPPTLSDTDASSAHPWLVLIHGTASNLEGAFDGLTAVLPGSAGRHADTWSRIEAMYRDRIVAFEHPTLTSDPTENAKALAAELAAHLPRGARLHLVTHSRGGLVGEALALAAELASIELRVPRAPAGAAGDPLYVSYDEHATNLRATHQVLEGHDLRVERFVRAACPADGTRLASGRLDRWANVILNGIARAIQAGLAAAAAATSGVGVPITRGLSLSVDLLRDVLLRALKHRHDTDVLPGLVAMKPDSAMVKLLRVQAESPAPLAVYAGVTRLGGGPKKFALRLLAAAFYREPNDLVVDTDAMYPGVPRRTASRPLRVRNRDIDHFRYFEQIQGREFIVNVLAGRRELASRDEARGAGLNVVLRPNVDPGWERLSDHARVAGPPRGTAPGVVVLPGIMASTLDLPTAGGDFERYWLDATRLPGDGVAMLTWGGAPVVARDVLAAYYAELVNRLAHDHHVLVLSYDWRDGIRNIAGRVLERIRSHFGATPPHVVAHSMGGIVARTAWMQATSNGGAAPFEQIIYLGTPNRGAWKATLPLSGRGREFHMLSAADERPRRFTLAQVREYQGLIDLIPNQRLAGASGRDELVQAYVDGFGGSAEVRERVQAAMDLWDDLELQQHDPPPGIVIGGSGRRTPARRLKNGKLRRQRSVPGDGTVPHASLLLGESRDVRLPIYYVDAGHSEIPLDDQAISIVRHSLAGTLDRVDHRFYSARSRSTEADVDDELDVDLWPDLEEQPVRIDSDDPLGQLFDGPIEGRGLAEDAAPAPVHVSITHGQLRHARFPVMVGHIAQDRIGGAQAEADRLLRGELSRVRALLPHQYPAELGEAHIVEQDGGVPPGVIVVGLGTIGTLTQKRLRQAIRDAAARFATRRTNAGSGTEGPRCISFVPLGSDILGGASVQATVEAIVLGVRDANLRLSEQGRDHESITTIEIIELYETRAAETLDAAWALSSTHPGVAVAPNITRVDGAVDGAPTSSWRHNAWVRADVTLKQESGTLKMDVTGHSAASWSGSSCLGAVASSDWGLRAAGRQPMPTLEQRRALFEALVPGDVKAELSAAGAVRLALDEASAAIPWELLHPTPDVGARSEGTPWCIHAGLIRTLKVDTDRRIARRDPRPDSALVIGDPIVAGTIYDQLPGARAEAAQVAARLSADFDVTEVLEREHTDVMTALLTTRARIVHVAAHGAYDAEDPHASGIVIGRDGYEPVYFPACAVAQLGVRPDVVFLNCCEIGAIEPLRGGALASSLAAEFLNLGCRAVVAAAWPVNDSVAAAFAAAFYDALLAGETFGNSVRRAREDARSIDRTLTWAAYQCYGDPEMRIRQARPAQSSRARRPSVAAQVHRELQKLRETARRITAGLVVNDAEQADRTLDDLDELVRALPDALAADPRVMSDVADARAALLQWEDAATIYRVLSGCADDSSPPYLAPLVKHVAHDDSAIPRGVKDQWAHLTVRNAVEQAIDGRRFPDGWHAVDAAQVKAAFKACCDARGPAAEDWDRTTDSCATRGLVASDQLRVARLLARSEADGHRSGAHALIEAARKTWRALAPNDSPPEHDHRYFAVAAHAVELAQLLRTGVTAASGPKQAAVTKQIGRLATTLGMMHGAAGRSREQGHVWSALVEAELALLHSWASGELSDAWNGVVAGYERAFALGLTPRDADSIADRWRLIADLLYEALAHGPATAPGTSHADRIDQTRRDLDLLRRLHNQFGPGRR